MVARWAMFGGEGHARTVDELVTMHETHLLPGFRDKRQEEQAIEVLTRSITAVRACSLLVPHGRSMPRLFVFLE